MAHAKESTQSQSDSLNQDETLNASATQPRIPKPKDLDEPKSEVKEDIAEEASTEEQPAKDTHAVNEELIALMQEQKKTIDDLKKGLYNQGRKLAETKVQEVDEGDSEQEQAKIVLREMGFLDEDRLKSEIEKIRKEQEDKSTLEQICSSNPNIDKKLLQVLGKAEPGKAWEDLIENYNLNKGVALNKAHNRPVMGMPISKEPEAPARPSQMSDEQFKKFIQDNSQGKIHSNYI